MCVAINCSQHSFGLPLRLNGMHITQFDHARLDLLSHVIWSLVFWQFVIWNLLKAQRWSNSVLTLDRCWLVLLYFHTFPYKFKVPTNSHRVWVACASTSKKRRNDSIGICQWTPHFVWLDFLQVLPCTAADSGHQMSKRKLKNRYSKWKVKIKTQKSIFNLKSQNRKSKVALRCKQSIQKSQYLTWKADMKCPFLKQGNRVSTTHFSLSTFDFDHPPTPLPLTCSQRSGRLGQCLLVRSWTSGRYGRRKEDSR